MSMLRVSNTRVAGRRKREATKYSRDCSASMRPNVLYSDGRK
jgi:hypothetical protein